jgi:hypothetical protein
VPRDDERVTPLLVSPRPLNEQEKVVLWHILSAEFEGVRELRAQIGLVEVVAVWGLGSVSVDFRLRGPAARSAQREGHIPVAADVLDAAGEYVGELLVWLQDGALAALEYAWVTDEMPTVLPAVERIRLCGGE